MKAPWFVTIPRKKLRRNEYEDKIFSASGIIAALYIAVTMLVAPFGFTEVQFRVSEMFNHLVAFNPRFAVGLLLVY